jgi:hypothetical protein
VNVGEGACACYWLEETNRYHRFLRRYSSSMKRPCVDGGFHNAARRLDTVARKKQPASGDSWKHDDPRWPTTCLKCGYVFQDDDYWQLSIEQIWRVTATADASYVQVGQRFVLSFGKGSRPEHAPPGALWNGTWMPDLYRGSDGIALIARCPNGSDWTVDGEATGGGHWTRSGDPRDPSTLVVSPSIAIGKAGTEGYFHGFLGSNGAAPGHFTGHLG